MIEFLVGYTGFVGSNLAHSHKFTGLFNSANIHEAYGQHPDILVYAGVRSEMFIANARPLEDKAVIETAKSNISRIAPKRIILISTVAVYPEPYSKDEDSEINGSLLKAYGANRLDLERWTEDNFPAHSIIRLPAVYGLNMRKNFLYDYIHVIPAMLTESKFQELADKIPELSDFYMLHDNGYFKCRDISQEEKLYLKNIFRELDFSALNFTDSRSIYQFYSLANLWSHIEIILSENLDKVNLVSPPISVADVYQFLAGKEFRNILANQPYNYDIKTKHYALFGGIGGYIMNREQELLEIRKFISGV